ncbi:MAG: fused MFS/spermidine synthase [Polyangia bacterium]|jgi:spermidine synthase|nr:fused MFS/spermidine synthase [Polyangia bacterium]
MSATKRMLVYLLFVLSGMAGLVYQVIWVRVLQYNFGNTDLAVSTVVAVYMGGLALGAWQSGRIALRLKRPILVYGLLEFAVAIYAIAVTPLLYRMDFLYGLVGVDASVSTLTALRFLAAAVLLFIPTVCMGATLPVLTVPLVRMERMGEGVSLLYFVNTLGAVLGSVLAGFVLVRFLGLQTSLYLAALIGVSVMLGSILLQRGLPPFSAKETTGSQQGGDAAPGALASLGETLSPRLGGVMALVAAGLCGFISLVNEVVWSRMLGFLLDGTVYGFSALLASFLLGIALGSLVIAPFIDSSKDLWGLFAKLQLMAGLGCLFTILMIPMVPGLADAFIGSGTGVEGGFAVKVFIVFLIILVPTIFFGASFPVLVTISARYRGQISQSMGSVYAANTLGSILGSICGGILLLGVTRDLNVILVGMVYMSLLLALAAGYLAFVGPLRKAIQRVGRDARNQAVAKGLGLVALPLAVIVTVGVMNPDVQIYRLVSARYAVEDYDRSLGFKVAKAQDASSNIVWKAQGRVTVVTVHRLDDGGLRLRNNGLNEAYHGTTEPRYAQVIWYLGLLPYILHPKPERALQIGLGGGGTAECLTTTALKELNVVELEREVVNASKFIYKTLVGPKSHPGDDKRVNIVVDDGRNALLRAARARPNYYDIIVSQPSHAWLSGVASLYTEEHFGVVRRNLRPGGIFCQWINLFRMDQEGLAALLKAFTLAFPAVHVFQVDGNSLLLIGGDSSLKLDPAVVEKHLSDKRIKTKADLFQIDAYKVFRQYLFGRKTALALAGSAAPNSDRFPIIEMRLPWVLHNDTIKIKDLLKRRRLPWGIMPEDLHRGPSWEAFINGLAEEMVTEFDNGKVPIERAKQFVDRAAAFTGVKGLMVQGRLARLSGDAVSAEAYYRKAAAAGDGDALFQLGSLFLTLERFDEAAKACGRAYEKTHLGYAHLCVVEAYLLGGKDAEARVVLDILFQRKEEEEAPAAQKWRGILQYREGKLEEARRTLEAFSKHDSGDDLAPYYLGLLAAGRGDHDLAKKWFAAAVANSRSIAEVASSTGERYAKRDQQLASVTRFRDAIRRQPDLSSAYKWMAKFLRRWGRYAEMEETLKTFAKEDPTGASTFKADFEKSASLAERVGLVLNSYRSELQGR